MAQRQIGSGSFSRVLEKWRLVRGLRVGRACFDFRQRDPNDEPTGDNSKEGAYQNEPDDEHRHGFGANEVPTVNTPKLRGCRRKQKRCRQ